MKKDLVISVNENPFELDENNFGDLTALCNRLSRRLEDTIRATPVFNFLNALEEKYYPENKLEVILGSNGRRRIMNSSFVRATVRGKDKGTKAHIFVLLYVASLYSPEVAIEAYESITQVDKILSALNSFDISEFEEELSSTPVYVFSAIEASTGNIKIGISKNPEQRIKQLQQGNPDSIVLSGYYLASNPYREKRQILESNSDKIIHGDWLAPML